MYLSIYLSLYVCSQNLLPRLEGNSIADFDEIWQLGPSWAVAMRLRKLAPDPFVA